MAKVILNEYANATPKRKEQLNAATKRYRQKNPQKTAAMRKRTDEKRKDAHKARNLAKYGLTHEDYLQLLEAQRGVCSIRLSPETLLTRWKTPRPLVVDHCHTTGKVRGLLCVSCNLGIGNFKDSTELLQNAINYLSV